MKPNDVIKTRCYVSTILLFTDVHILPACSALQNENPYYFMQDGAPSHTANVTQAYLKETFGRRFIKKDEWPPNSPDCNPLNYFFWDVVKGKVQGETVRFENINQLKRKIRKVWKDSFDLPTLRKAIMQFRPRLQTVVEEDGGPIKVHFG